MSRAGDVPWRLSIAVMLAAAACGGGGGAGGGDGGGQGGGSGGQVGDAGGGQGGQGGGVGDAGRADGLPECAACESTAACAPGLECGHPFGTQAVAFCVDPYGTAECCPALDSCYIIEGSMRAATQCPTDKPATSSACERQGRCFYGAGPFQTPCECVASVWQCHECPAAVPSGACPGSDGQLCLYGGMQCSCQTSGTWHCNACPATTTPVGACNVNDYCGYAGATGCFCSAGSWGCLGP